MGLVFDIVLAATVVYVAWRTLFSKELLTGALFFVVLGLLMALAWVRMQAPDIALAEAAVSAGLTGTLFLRAAGQVTSRSARGVRPSALGRASQLRRAPTIAVVALAVGLLAVLLLSVASYTWPRPGLARQVERLSAELGLEQPVTAVVVVFRGYDTWLEMAVVLTTVLAILGTHPFKELLERKRDEPGDPLLSRAVRVVLPIAALFAGYLLWQGSHGPGGAFQGGGVAAAAIVLGYMAGVTIFSWIRTRGGRLLLLAGFALPVLLTAPRLIAGEPLFSFPRETVGTWVVVVEIAIGISVALFLSQLLVGAEPAPEGETKT